MLLVGREYLGPSLPLIDETLAGIDPGPSAFAWKLVFTAIAIGCGFPGGEVTPLFVIGTTLGGTLAGLLGIPIPVLTLVGLVAVFAGTRTRRWRARSWASSCSVPGPSCRVAVGCVIAFVTSSHRGIYSSQRIDVAKGHHVVDGLPTVSEWHAANHAAPDLGPR